MNCAYLHFPYLPICPPAPIPPVTIADGADQAMY